MTATGLSVYVPTYNARVDVRMLSGGYIFGAGVSGLHVPLWSGADGVLYTYSGVACTSGRPAFGLSGSVPSGMLVGTHYVPSGIVSFDPKKCFQCGKSMWGGSGEDHVRIRIGGTKQRICLACIGYRNDLKKCENRGDWIRESVPLPEGTPDYAIADYLEEWGRTKDAEYIRKNMLTSGG